jgi:hypothetical protein
VVGWEGEVKQNTNEMTEKQERRRKKENRPKKGGGKKRRKKGPKKEIKENCVVMQSLEFY